jgi:hypothetical protein
VHDVVYYVSGILVEAGFLLGIDWLHCLVLQLLLIVVVCVVSLHIDSTWS